MKRLTVSIFIASVFLLGFSIFMKTPNVHAAFTPSDTPLPNGYVTDAEVWTSLVHNSNLYIGGDFTRVGPYQSRLAMLNTTTGAESATPIPTANNSINNVISDGDGGWFVGGNFTVIGDLPRLRIAHILEDGSVDPDFIFDANGSIMTMYLDGATLYFGGSFTTVNGTARGKAASVDLNTMTLNSFNPAITTGGSGVLAIDVEGGVVYVGGDFTSVNSGASLRGRIAALDSITGTATSWNPNATSGAVWTIAAEGSTIYVGGSFINIGGAGRNRIAQLSSGSNTADPTWNPNSSATVYQLQILDGSTLFARFSDGANTTIGGQVRNYLAKISRTGTGLADAAWNANVPTRVLSYAITGSDLYIAGEFLTVNSIARRYIAKLSLADASVSSWNPADISARVTDIATDGTNVFIGGDFTVVSGFFSPGVAIFDTNLNLVPFDPFDGQTPGLINAMVISGNDLYLGGAMRYFKDVGFIDDFFKVDLSLGEIDESFDMGIDSQILSMDLEGNILYLGGWFEAFGVTPRFGAAAIDITSDTLTGFDPNVNNAVYSIDADHTLGQVFLAGFFNQVGGNAAPNLASVATVSGAFISNLNTNGAVFGLSDVSGNTYATGSFSTLNSVSKNGLGLIQGAFSADVGGDGWSVYVDPENQLYAGGSFSTVNGQPTGYAALFDASGNLTPWNSQITGSSGIVITFARFGDYLVVGGDFLTVAGEARQHLAFFEEAVAAPTVPDAIVNLSATAGDEEVDLTWTAPDDGGAAITDYVIQYGITSGGFPGNAVTFNDGTSTNTFVTVTGLTNDTEYSFHVAAVNAESQGAYSNVDTATPTAGPVPLSGSDNADITVDINDFLSFSIENIAVGDEAAGDQPFGAGAEITDLTSTGSNDYAISGSFGSPVYTRLETTTNSNDGYNVIAYASNLDGRTNTLLRSGGTPGSAADEISDTLSRLPSSQAANQSIVLASSTGLAFRLIDASTSSILREADEDTQWGDGDAGTALWASFPLGSGAAQMIYDTVTFSEAATTAYINWFVGISPQQRSGSYSGQVTFTASVN
jgi:hypothetical protein